MTFRDLIRMGFKNLIRRKTRTILTILGVIIGTSAILVMLSLGIGMNVSFRNQVESMGSLNTIDVNRLYSETGPGEARLDDKAVAAIEAIEGVEVVMPVMRTFGQLKVGRYEGHVSIIGLDLDKVHAFDYPVAEGRLPLAGGRNEIIFGMNMNQNFYNPRARGRWEPVEVDLMTQSVKLIPESQMSEQRPKGISLNVVGIFEQTQTEIDWNAYMAMEEVEKLKAESPRNNGDRRGQSQEDKYETLKVKVYDIDDVQEIQDQIKALGYQAWSLSDILESMQQTTMVIQAVLGGIGAVSLFVAALGITNTMIMSIYERTKEIGVMKVIGARLADIKNLFLLEAGLIGFFGGLLGILLSLGLSMIINRVGVQLLGSGFMGPGGAPEKISIIPLWLIGASLAFSTTVGLISGYYPARRAMRLSALEAIRNE